MVRQSLGTYFQAYFRLTKYISLIYNNMYQPDILEKIMKRQKLMKSLITVSLLLFPVTLYKLLYSIRNICDLAGYDLGERIVLVDRQNGRVWR